MKKTILTQAVNILVVIVMMIAVTPIFFHGKNAIFSIHDNMDSTMAWAKMLKDNGLLLALNSPTNVLGNMSSAYFSLNYNIFTFAFLIFDIFTAYLVMFIVKILVGYGSMFILLKHLWPNKEYSNIIKLVSLSFALLPSMPLMWVMFDSIPLLCYAFLIIMKWDNARIDKRVFLLILYPFLSGFISVGFFVLVIWTIGVAIQWICNKKINLNLITGLVLLALGYILVDLKTFYVIFILKTPLNRGILEFASFPVGEMLSDVLKRFIVGVYFVPNVTHLVVLPTIVLAFISIIIFLLFKLKKRDCGNKSYDLANYSLSMITLFGVMLLFTLAFAAHKVSFINSLVGTVLPVLKGFNWGRFIFLNRTVYYISFALTLITLSALCENQKRRYFIYLIACMQIAVVMFYSGTYGHTYFNLNHAATVKEDEMLTFNEFYAEGFFDDIKDDIGYKGEGVAALGFHPSVLMYNGFSSIDGYISSYPLTRMLSFREVIAPQLERNPVHQRNYDRWGGRMYLYNDDLDYRPTRIKSEAPVELLINVTAFCDIGGTYIFSRAEIVNTEELGFDFISQYCNSDVIYDIYVYKVRNS